MRCLAFLPWTDANRCHGHRISPVCQLFQQLGAQTALWVEEPKTEHMRLLPVEMAAALVPQYVAPVYNHAPGQGAASPEHGRGNEHVHGGVMCETHTSWTKATARLRPHRPNTRPADRLQPSTEMPRLAHVGVSRTMRFHQTLFMIALLHESRRLRKFWTRCFHLKASTIRFCVWAFASRFGEADSAFGAEMITNSLLIYAQFFIVIFYVTRTMAPWDGSTFRIL